MSDPTQIPKNKAAAEKCLKLGDYIRGFCLNLLCNLRKPASMRGSDTAPLTNSSISKSIYASIEGGTL